MENKTIPTAEEYTNKALDGLGRINKEHAIYLMIEFAKLHVIEALKQASEKATGTPMYDYGNRYKIELVRDNVNINEDSILNAYPLENIK